ncbi:hypothetical protein V1478_004771 [Vespula squamosa]|uniref:Uncharacterized protein n=1 Tax=Vespula squamosa TaxID=30214 RepID=A0ABD2BER0_VESSQ
MGFSRFTRKQHQYHYQYQYSTSASEPASAPAALLPNDKFLGPYPARFIRVCLTFKSRLASVIPIGIKQISGKELWNSIDLFLLFQTNHRYLIDILPPRVAIFGISKDKPTVVRIFSGNKMKGKL